MNTENRDSVGSHRDRLKIANGIARVFACLHNAFPRPIINRNLRPDRVIIDQNGVAKMFDFSDAMLLPPGKLEIEDSLQGAFSYIDPEYVKSGIVTPKIDVYCFGALILVLVTGKHVEYQCLALENCCYLDTKNLTVDPRILKENGGMEEKKQFQDVLALALKCTQAKGEDRPDMIYVAKELCRIEKHVL
ncbi:Protein kinase superfamily protein [Abeliophyllum distichum]|uniref:Protein kinase superfamily protein n=1 Tax=Abeliophyllum distichum TaxID=126358 RepID=A0ABD1TK57_9LAMI